MKAVRKTVDMIAVFRRGEIPEPVRFRYTDHMGKEVVIKIDKVIDLHIDNFNTPKNITYTCQSLVGRRQLQYDIQYIGREIRWELYKVGDM